MKTGLRFLEFREYRICDSETLDHEYNGTQYGGLDIPSVLRECRFSDGRDFGCSRGAKDRYPLKDNADQTQLQVKEGKSY